MSDPHPMEASVEELESIEHVEWVRSEDKILPALFVDLELINPANDMPWSFYIVIPWYMPVDLIKKMVSYIRDYPWTQVDLEQVKPRAVKGDITDSHYPTSFIAHMRYDFGVFL